MLSRAETVTWLAGHPRSTASEFAVASGGEVSQAQKMLHRLLESGAVRREMIGGGGTWLWSAVLPAAGGVRSAIRDIHLDGPDGVVAVLVREAAAQAVDGGQVTFLVSGGEPVAKIIPAG